MRAVSLFLIQSKYGKYVVQINPYYSAIYTVNETVSVVDLYKKCLNIYVCIYIHTTWNVWARHSAEEKCSCLLNPFCFFHNKICFWKSSHGRH